jgi:hypothetical protein
VVRADEDCSSEGKAEAVSGGVCCGDALGRVLKGYMWWQHEQKPRGLVCGGAGGVETERAAIGGRRARELGSVQRGAALAMRFCVERRKVGKR